MSEHFEKAAVRRWRREVWREFERGGFDAIEIQAALVMAAIAIVGTDTESLSELTGLSAEYARKVMRRLRKHRVLSGQTIRVAWETDGLEMSVFFDAMVAAGILTRSPNPKRSAAQKARAPETRARGPRGPRRQAARVVGPYTPTIKKADPWYGLPEWERAKAKEQDAASGTDCTAKQTKSAIAADFPVASSPE